jgi:hypothetical protein
VTTARKIAELVLSCDGMGKTRATLQVSFGDPDTPSLADCDKASLLLDLLLQLVNEEVPVEPLSKA